MAHGYVQHSGDGFVLFPPGDIGGRCAAAGLGLLLIYLWLVRCVLGSSRPPSPSAVTAQPPEGLSAAACRFIWRRDYDDKCLATALVDLAVKGVVRISELKPNFRAFCTGHDEATRCSDPAAEPQRWAALLPSALAVDAEIEWTQRAGQTLLNAARGSVPASIAWYKAKFQADPLYLLRNIGVIASALSLAGTMSPSQTPTYRGSTLDGSSGGDGGGGGGGGGW